MRNIAVTLAAAVLVTTNWAAPAFAHHGWSTYDAAKQQDVTGTITALKWEQPHAVLHISRNGETIEVWLSPLARMVERGLKREALSTGKTVTIDAQPSTKAGGEWKAQAITVDGKTYDLMR